jgi:hypothetical protein
MRLLLDTHTFIGWDSDPARLSAVALAALRDPANTVQRADAADPPCGGLLICVVRHARSRALFDTNPQFRYAGGEVRGD